MSKDWHSMEVRQDNILVAYMETEDKFDYIYNINKELVAEVYNNDYKVIKVLSKLQKEIEKAKK